MKSVKVFGPGCRRCDSAVAMVRDTATALGIDVEVEKVVDPKSIAQAGVMATPGIAVDGKLVHSGGLPDPEKLQSWLRG
ncbi:thioredoxin family protein [Mangrovicoccus sp. HB161399]|uniref:thioredoxin family protein n=1 Tax=Mangrovicoccus sp. HB161399 TaxID=2720392 RepID=UPI00155464E7|nr:thioredoxin family protein [Mangrovicoccus sp. HB161399]